MAKVTHECRTELPIPMLTTGGSLKRSLGMAYLTLTIPKAFGFEDATLSDYRDQMQHAATLMLTALVRWGIILPCRCQTRLGGRVNQNS